MVCLYNLHSFCQKMGLMLDMATGLLGGVGEIALVDMPAQCLVHRKCSLHVTSLSPSLPSSLLYLKRIHDPLRTREVFQQKNDTQMSLSSLSCRLMVYLI